MVDSDAIKKEHKRGRKAKERKGQMQKKGDGLKEQQIKSGAEVVH